MRTRPLLGIVGIIASLIFLGALGGFWVADLDDLLVPGAEKARAVRASLTHARLSYVLPGGQTIHDLNRYLVQGGWRRERQLNLDRSFGVFTRRRVFGSVLEVLTIDLSELERRQITLSIVRCVRISRWTWCGAAAMPR